MKMWQTQRCSPQIPLPREDVLPALVTPAGSGQVHTLALCCAPHTAAPTRPYMGYRDGQCRLESPPASGACQACCSVRLPPSIYFFPFHVSYPKPRLSFCFRRTQPAASPQAAGGAQILVPRGLRSVSRLHELKAHHWNLSLKDHLVFSVCLCICVT